MCTLSLFLFTTAILIEVQFHRGEYTVGEVKQYLEDKGFLVRRFEPDV
jgi:glutamine amidotransferase/cyclase